MTRQWWRAREAWVRVWLLFLCIFSLIFADLSLARTVKKKGKATVTETSKSSLKKTSGTVSASRKRNSSVGSRKSKKTTRTRNTGKHQRNKKQSQVAAKSSSKTSRYVKSKRSRKSMGKTRKSRQKSGRASEKNLLVNTPTLSATERELVTRNYGDSLVSISYDPEISSFPLEVNRERFVHRVNSVFVLPEEEITLRAGGRGEENKYILHPKSDAVQIGPNTWSWKAPQKVGVYPINIQHPHWNVATQLNVFVMAPLSLAKNGNLNGYRIGNYPKTAYRQRSSYSLPRGFIEVTEENENTLVSPHFRLRQFLCKQEGSYPKYITLDPRLLIVLEAVLQKVNERGHHCPTLSIMSGYRTPYYNRAIGNSTTYSRHLWGDAADIFVDSNPIDGEMDDLNHDGFVDIRDTEMLYDIVSEMYASRAKRFLAGSFFSEPILSQLVTSGYANDARVQKLLTGGLARYRGTGSHGPFVHVDVRGVFTQWGG